ncbi:MAG: hypothetical protein FJY88_01140 [Candidatus Eisenbacteria bacterium]|nr:hypothetical protein [Candidatus Eisenbacteria bacterium]
MSKRTRSAVGSLLAGASALLFLTTCSDDKGKPQQPLPPVSDYAFSLLDVNTNSATHGQRISPAGFPGRPVVLLAGSGG